MNNCPKKVNKWFRFKPRLLIKVLFKIKQNVLDTPLIWSLNTPFYWSFRLLAIFRMDILLVSYRLSNIGLKVKG
jgi:hypothetical protein